MKDRTQSIRDALERATEQLDQMEKLINLLVNDLDLKELKTNERLNLATKLMAQHAHTLKLRENLCEEDDVFFAKMRQWLQDSYSDQPLDDPSHTDGYTSTDALDTNFDLFLREQKIYPYNLGEEC